MFQCLSVFALAAALTATGGRAWPMPAESLLSFADEKAERDSEDSNEVGPAGEDWKLLNRLSKTGEFDPAEVDKARAVMKEIEEFTRLVQSGNGTAAAGPGNETAEGRTPADDVDDAEAEGDASSSDWTAVTWRNLIRNGDDGDYDDGGQRTTYRTLSKSERQEAAAADDDDNDGNFEDIVKKISTDLKKLYVKVKQVMTVVKNWYAFWNVANTVFTAAAAG